jgi:hypothetical protein
MLITFHSQAAGDVMMFDHVARQMLRIIGKNPMNRGIVTVGQLPEAIAALRGAAIADRAGGPDGRPGAETTGQGDAESQEELFVSASQRAWPLIELFEWSLKADKPVLWEG